MDSSKAMIRTPTFFHTTRSFVVLGLIGALFSGCAKPSAGDGELRVTIVPEWDGQPFQISTEYLNATDYRVFVDGLRMYLAEAQLIGPNGTVDLYDIDLFNLNAGPVSRIHTVPSGTYSTMHVGIGVPEALNNSDPAQYPQGHPLSVSNGTYWTWTTGYRFVIFEGRYDVDPNGTGTVLPNFSIHTGLDTCYTTTDLVPAVAMVIPDGGLKDVTLRVDVSRFFHSSSDTLDLAVDDQFHGGSNIDVALRLTENIKGALSLD